MKFSGCLCLAWAVSVCAAMGPALGTAAAQLEEYVFSLDKLGGKYTSKGKKESKALHFDAGMQFDEIESVELRIKGVVQPGAMKIYRAKKDQIWKKGFNPTINVLGEEIGSDDVIFGHLRRRKSFEALISLNHKGHEGTEAWQCLMDGKLDLQIGLTLPKMSGNVVSWQSRLASFKASEVELVVTGVQASPVPEPGLAVGGVGLAMLALKRRRRA